MSTKLCAICYANSVTFVVSKCYTIVKSQLCAYGDSIVISQCFGVSQCYTIVKSQLRAYGDSIVISQRCTFK